MSSLSETLDALAALSDAERRVVSSWLREYEFVQRAKASGQFLPGQMVRFTHRVRPIMLQGAAAMVKGLRNGKVVVDLVTPRGKWSTGIRCDATMLERMEEPGDGNRAQFLDREVAQ